MSANLKAKLSEDRFEALALRVQWRHKTAAHHSTDQHLCGLRAALPLPLLHLVLGHQLPQSLRILSLNLTAVFQVPARQTPIISFWSVHQKIISYVVQVESWAIIETKEARLAKRCEIDILLKPQANTLAVLFQAHQPLQVSALSPPAKFSKVLFSSSNCYEGKANLPPIPKITAPTGHHSLQSVHHYLWKQDTCQQPTVTWGLSDSFELYQDWQVTI